MAWALDMATKAASDAVHGIPYDGGGPWDPSQCATRWTPRAAALASAVRAAFSWVRTIGGLRCSPLDTSTGQQMSIHAVGRALDVMVPTNGGPEGLALANWCVANAAAFGIQLVIWNHSVWQANLPAVRRISPYTGSNPHVDHVHIEVIEGNDPSGVAPVPPSSSSSSADYIPAAIVGAVLIWRAMRKRR